MKLPFKLPEKLPLLLDRFKYPILVLLLGLALVLLPERSKGKNEEPAAPVPLQTEAEAEDGADYCDRLERELEALLSQIEGAGKVKVMLTLRTGPAARYQTDRSESKNGDGTNSSASLEEKTVMLEQGSAYNVPAIVSTEYPVFQGALVVAEGGADPAVRYQLSAAVAALLGLGADRITVLKMK